MNRFESFSARRPLLFGLAVTLVFILMVLVSSMVAGAIWPAETPGWYIGSTIGRLVSIAILLLILHRLGWLGPAGFARLGSGQMWLILLPLLVYSILVSALVMTGNLDFAFSDPALAGLAVVFLMSQAFLEETAFRGLVLHGFVRAWGDANSGLIKSVMVSALVFGGMHVIYLAGEPMLVVINRIMIGFLLGIFLGSLVLTGGSIYPAVIFHGILNTAGFLNLTSNVTQGTSAPWLWLSLAMLPLAICGLYLLRDVRRFYPPATQTLKTSEAELMYPKFTD